MEVRISKLTLLALALVVIGVALRLIPHTANFAPVGAIALFAGAVLSWRIALWLPLMVMAASDLVLGLHATVPFTWGGFVLIALFGMLWRNQSNLLRILLGAAGAALIFFAVSNFGVWAEGQLYPPTWQGLADAYVTALPFLRSSFLADLGFSALFFGLYAFVAPAFTGGFTVRLGKPAADATQP